MRFRNVIFHTHVILTHTRWSDPFLDYLQLLLNLVLYGNSASRTNYPAIINYYLVLAVPNQLLLYTLYISLDLLTWCFFFRQDSISLSPGWAPNASTLWLGRNNCLGPRGFSRRELRGATQKTDGFLYILLNDGLKLQNLKSNKLSWCGDGHLSEKKKLIQPTGL